MSKGWKSPEPKPEPARKPIANSIDWDKLNESMKRLSSVMDVPAELMPFMERQVVSEEVTFLGSPLITTSNVNITIPAPKQTPVDWGPEDEVRGA